MKNRIPQQRLLRTVIIVGVAFVQHRFAGAQATGPNEPRTTTENLIAAAAPVPAAVPDTLPDAPEPQEQNGKPEQQSSQTHINPIPLLPPRLVAGTSLSAHDKWEIYYHKTYSPAAFIYPLFGAGIQMANPKKAYPREWKDGMGAFGRIYGNQLAQRAARSTADFGTQVIFHEDPRYQRSTSSNPVIRIGHALAWTLVDKSDSGHRMVALSTFTSSAAGGFVGMAYLPNGYNDATHAEQRMAMGIEARAFSNVITEFETAWGPWAAKLHVPKLLPEWWTRQPKN